MTGFQVLIGAVGVYVLLTMVAMVTDGGFGGFTQEPVSVRSGPGTGYPGHLFMRCKSRYITPDVVGTEVRVDFTGTRNDGQKVRVHSYMACLPGQDHAFLEVDNLDDVAVPGTTVLLGEDAWIWDRAGRLGKHEISLLGFIGASIPLPNFDAWISLIIKVLAWDYWFLTDVPFLRLLGGVYSFAVISAFVWLIIQAASGTLGRVL